MVLIPYLEFGMQAVSGFLEMRQRFIIIQVQQSSKAFFKTKNI
jgi:hypothetical protein